MKTLQTSRCKQVRFNLKLREIHSPESAAPQAETLQSRSRSKLSVLGFGFSQPHSFPKACRDIQMSQKGKQNWECYSRICPVWNQTWHGDMDEHLPWTQFSITTTKKQQKLNKAEKWNALRKFPQKFPEAQNSRWVCLMLWKQRNKHTPQPPIYISKLVTGSSDSASRLHTHSKTPVNLSAEKKQN